MPNAELTARKFARPEQSKPTHLTPTIWALTEDRPGNNSQSIGLAKALGWPYEVKEVRFRALARLPNRLLGASRIGIDSTRSASMAPPWPDLVIATGRRLAPVARWIQEQNPARTRLVHLGRKGGHVTDHFDLVVTCAHFRFPPHPKRIETLAPLNPVIREQLAQAADRWPSLFGDTPRPHIVLLVGGTSAVCRLDPATARRLGEDVRAFAQAAGGTVHAVTSRRTGAQAAEALSRGLGKPSHVHRWHPGPCENPYLGYLASADVIVVTGDSESMLADTAACGKPVYIYPLPERLPSLIMRRVREFVVARAQGLPREKGAVHPQQGLGYLCAWLIARGIVLPPRDLTALHQSFIHAGIARSFGAPLELGKRPILCETEEVARAVRALLGTSYRDHADSLTSAGDSGTPAAEQ